MLQQLIWKKETKHTSCVSLIIQQDSAAAIVKSKKKEDTAEGTIKNWIAIFGAPESYFVR